MKKFLIAAMLAVGVTGVATAPAVAGPYASQRAGYHKYANQRFGFSILVPNGFVANPPPANHDGRSFHDAYGAEFMVWGSNNVLDKTVMGEYREALRRHPDAAYSTYGKGWYVISYHEGGYIVYEKHFISPRATNSWVFKYPASRASVMNPVCSVMAKSFRPGW